MNSEKSRQCVLEENTVIGNMQSNIEHTTKLISMANTILDNMQVIDNDVIQDNVKGDREPQPQVFQTIQAQQDQLNYLGELLLRIERISKKI